MALQAEIRLCLICTWCRFRLAVNIRDSALCFPSLAVPGLCSFLRVALLHAHVQHICADCQIAGLLEDEMIEYFSTYELESAVAEKQLGTSATVHHLIGDQVATCDSTAGMAIDAANRSATVVRHPACCSGHTCTATCCPGSAYY